MRIVFLLAILILVIALPVAAAPPDTEGAGQIYVVQADDWLSKLADKFYGDPLAYPAIVAATNQQAAQDDSYAAIANPDVIEIGQKLFIPAPEADTSVVAQAEADPPITAAPDIAPATSPSPEQQALLAELTVKGSPPELFNEVWLNSEPLKLADLHGQVVIVEFWTYG